jgi:hypothetical protein
VIEFIYSLAPIGSFFNHNALAFYCQIIVPDTATAGEVFRAGACHRIIQVTDGGAAITLFDALVLGIIGVGQGGKTFGNAGDFVKRAPWQCFLITFAVYNQLTF